MSDTKDNNLSDEIIKITHTFNQLNFIDCQNSADINDPDGNILAWLLLLIWNWS